MAFSIGPMEEEDEYSRALALAWEEARMKAKGAVGGDAVMGAAGEETGMETATAMTIRRRR